MASRSKAPLSYAASLTIAAPARDVTSQSQPPVAVASVSAKKDQEAIPFQVRGRRPLEDKADPSVLYLHPEGKKMLRLYAVEKGVKVHDLLLEAVEQWAAERGLRGPWRVPSAGPPRRQRS